MRDALRIFRKDVRRFWLRVLFVIAIELLAGWAGIRADRRHGADGVSAEVHPMDCAVVSDHFRDPRRVACGRSPVLGDPSDFLEEPASLESAFLLRVYQSSGSCGGCGHPDIPELVAAGLSAGAACGSVLRSGFGGHSPSGAGFDYYGLVRAVWVFLACVCGFYLFVLVLSSHELTAPSWGSLEWLHGIVDSGFALVVVAAIVVFQYARRATGYSRVALAAGLVAFPLTFWTPGWRTAFDVQSRLTSGRAQDSVARLAFDPGRDPHPQPKGSLRRGGQIAWSVTIPVRVSGSPPGWHWSASGPPQVA